VDVSVDATLLSGSPDDVQFACENLPAGASCDFTPPACSPTCTAALSLATDPSTPDGTYAVTVSATDGSITRTAEFLLTVATPPPPFDFTVTVDPESGSVEPGGSLNLTVGATLVSGSTHEVEFFCEDLPVDTACDFTPPSCWPTCGADLVLTTSPNTPDGTYTVMVSATDRTITRTAPFLLTVARPPSFDFALASDPSSGSVEAGGSLNVSVDTTLLSGASHDVEFSCQSLPEGSSCWFSPPACSPTCRASLLLLTERDTAEGTYAVLVTATDGSISRSARFVLTVQAPLPLPNPVPPTANFTFTPAEPRVGDPVTFDASSSTSEPGTTLQAARWDWNGDSSGESNWDTPWTSSLEWTHVFDLAQTYSVIVQVRDSNGLSDMEQRTVVVGLPPVLPDTTPPTVSIVSPAAGSMLSSKQVRVTGTASDDRAVAVVHLSLDGTTWMEAFGIHSWSAFLTLGEGTQTIIARAMDVANNTREASVTVVVQVSGSGGDPTAAGSAWPAIGALLTVLLGTAAGLAALALSAAYFAESAKRARPAPRASRTRVERLRTRVGRLRPRRATPPRPP
jgi:hypothetical protein